MYRIKKCSGWNKYRIQKKLFLFIWLEYKYYIYSSKDKAELMVEILNVECK